MARGFLQVGRVKNLTTGNRFDLTGLGVRGEAPAARKERGRNAPRRDDVAPPRPPRSR